jgi:hypothetical protein
VLLVMVLVLLLLLVLLPQTVQLPLLLLLLLLSVVQQPPGCGAQGSLNPAGTPAGGTCGGAKVVTGTFQ